MEERRNAKKVRASACEEKGGCFKGQGEEEEEEEEGGGGARELGEVELQSGCKGCVHAIRASMPNTATSRTARMYLPKVLRYLYMGVN
jgi:hypothetical protein